MDAEYLIDQWRDAAYQAARIVARKFRATPQERRDILDGATGVLWACISRGRLTADTDTALALCVLTRAMASLPIVGIKSWRPNAYKGDSWRYHKRNVVECSVVGAAKEGAFEESIAREYAPYRENGAKLCAELLRVCSLSERQVAAIRGKLDGLTEQEIAARIGVSASSVHQAYLGALVKFRESPRAEQIRELLSC